MRRPISVLTAACVLALAACERPGDGQASSPQANSGGVCGRGRNPTLRIWASDIPRLD